MSTSSGDREPKAVIVVSSLQGFHALCRAFAAHAALSDVELVHVANVQQLPEVARLLSSDALVVEDALLPDDLEAHCRRYTAPLLVRVTETMSALRVTQLLERGARAVVDSDADIAGEALRVFAAAPEAERVRWAASERAVLSAIVARSAPMLRVIEGIRMLAKSPHTSAIITGETGAGKELVAQSIHQLSTRARAPLVAVDCGAIPEHLVESELFGHVRGAFTGANADHPGRFRLAGDGTLFLDEVGELPLPVQAKLLRALEERVVWPVGAARSVPFNARVLAATHRSLKAMVAEGTFRRDLYYRLAVFELALPPLRERGADVLLIAERFVERFAAHSGKSTRRLSREAEAALVSYDFPGNVRELRNVIEAAVMRATGEQVEASDLSLSRTQAVQDPSRVEFVLGRQSMDEIIRELIIAALKTSCGNATRAASVLGLDRLRLRRLIQRHQIPHQPKRGGARPSAEA